ncbi:MAG: DUF72 domain-containing protein [Gemmatimonas sp.]
MDLRTGTSGYSYREWKGSFYPETLSAKKMLNFYGQHFRAVEINYTFRSAPTDELLVNWAAEVPKDFHFALKAPQRITHIQRLRNVKPLVDDFFAVAKTLRKSLGPVLFQLPPNFKVDLDRLREFLAVLPKKQRCAIEFRNDTWFTDDVFGLLRKHKVAFCFAEAEGDLSVPFVSTTDWGYVRLREYEYTNAQFKKWLKKFREQGWKDAYVFFKHEDEGNGPRYATRLTELAAKA